MLWDTEMLVDQKKMVISLNSFRKQTVLGNYLAEDTTNNSKQQSLN